MDQDTNKNYYQGCKSQVDADTETEKKRLLKQMEGKYIAQAKLDGNWAAVHGGKELVVMSRSNEPFKNHGLPAFPKGTLVIGELAHGSQTGRKRKEELGHAVIDVFDILFFNHEWLGDLPDVERRKRLERWHSKLWKDAKPFYNLLPLWEDRFVERYEDSVEGLILREKGHGAYKPGTKTKAWWKIKKMLEADMVIIDMKLSTAETKTKIPMVEHIVVGQHINGVLKPLVKVGSMDHATSADIAANFGQYKGRVVEVKGWAPRFESGSVRHPSLVRFRDDKKPEDCVWAGDK